MPDEIPSSTMIATGLSTCTRNVVDWESLGITILEGRNVEGQDVARSAEAAPLLPMRIDAASINPAMSATALVWTTPKITRGPLPPNTGTGLHFLRPLLAQRWQG